MKKKNDIILVVSFFFLSLHCSIRERDETQKDSGGILQPTLYFFKRNNLQR
jgi:hypothetical protein